MKNWKNLPKNRKVFLLLLLVSVICVVLFLIFSIVWLGYLAISVIAIFYVFEIKEVLSFEFKKPINGKAFRQKFSTFNKMLFVITVIWLFGAFAGIGESTGLFGFFNFIVFGGMLVSNFITYQKGYYDVILFDDHYEINDGNAHWVETEKFYMNDIDRITEMKDYGFFAYKNEKDKEYIEFSTFPKSIRNEFKIAFRELYIQKFAGEELYKHD